MAEQNVVVEEDKSDNESDNVEEKKSSLKVLRLDVVDSLIQGIFEHKSDSDDESDVEAAFCKTCGDRINDYEKFKENDNNCQECTALKELGILKYVDLKFTTNFFDYIIYGVCFSPMVWIWIPLIDESDTLFICIVSIYLIIAGISLFIFVRYLYRHKVVTLHKIPLGLTPCDNYTYIMMICILISNILVIIESLRVYFQKNLNIVFECNNIFGYVSDDVPAYCLVYIHLLSNAIIIFISSLLINLMIMREIKYDAKKSWSKVKKEVIPSHHTGYQFYESLEKRYYSIHKFKRSPVPTIKMLTRSHAKYSVGWYRAVIILIIYSAFCLVISCGSFYILGDNFIDKLNANPAHYISVIISIITADIMFNLLFIALYELSWVFEKAYAVMTVTTKPFKDASTIHADMDVKFNNSQYIEDNKDNDDNDNDNDIYKETDINVNDIKIWWDLRSYGFKTLPLFYEITDPIMTTLVLSVIGFTIYWLYELFIRFESDVDSLQESIQNDSVRFILCVITAVIIIQTLYILKYFLRPYSVLYAQIKMAQTQVIALRFEIVNEQKNSKRKKYLSECITLYEKLIGFMKIELSTQAPRILGIKVTSTRLKALQSYIIGFIVVFAGSVWESWFGAVHSLAT